MGLLPDAEKPTIYYPHDRRKIALFDPIDLTPARELVGDESYALYIGPSVSHFSVNKVTRGISTLFAAVNQSPDFFGNTSGGESVQLAANIARACMSPYVDRMGRIRSIAINPRVLQVHQPVWFDEHRYIAGNKEDKPLRGELIDELRTFLFIAELEG